MASRLRIADHPVHPALVHLPIGLWFAVIAWDALAWVWPDPLWWQLGYWCLALGLLAAAPTIAAGLFDYLALEPDDPAGNTATAHMMIMLTATAVFGASWLLRAQAGTGVAPPVWSLACDLAGTVLMSTGGWLGGTLVYRHGLGGERRRYGQAGEPGARSAGTEG